MSDAQPAAKHAEAHGFALKEALRDKGFVHFHPTSFHLLGLSYWVPSLMYCTLDQGLGDDAQEYLCPEGQGLISLNEKEQICALLTSPKARDFIKERGVQWAFFRRIDQEIETLCNTVGIRPALPPAMLRDWFEDKTNAAAIARHANVPIVPQVLAKIDNFYSLRCIAQSQCWGDIVVQLPQGHSGTTTFFISSIDDYKRYADKIRSGGSIKVSPQLDVRGFALEACITDRGVFVSPLTEEISGDDRLSPYNGGWCGNQISPNGLAAGLNPQAQSMAQRLGRIMKCLGYRGVFGLDFLWDLSAKRLLLGEINARVTGISPLLNLTMTDTGPILLYHLAEYAGIPTPEPARFGYSGMEASQLMLPRMNASGSAVTSTPPTGIYKLIEGKPILVQQTTDLHLLCPGHAFFLCNTPVGSRPELGSVLGRIVLAEAILNNDGQLTEIGLYWYTAFQRLFSYS